jgi:hypothetical protein
LFAVPVGLFRVLRLGNACIVEWNLTLRYNKKSSNKGLKIGYKQ